MTKKLEKHASIEIVRKALGNVHPTGDLNRAKTLGDLMPTAGERAQFRRTVRQLVKEKKFDIASAAIPIFPHTKLDEIIHALSMSALPGSPTTEKQDDKPPEPPPPKGGKSG